MGIGKAKSLLLLPLNPASQGRTTFHTFSKIILFSQPAKAELSTPSQNNILFLQPVRAENILFLQPVRAEILFHTFSKII